MVAVSLAFLSLAFAIAAGVGGNPLSTHPDVGAARRPYPFVLAPLHTPAVEHHRLVNNSYIVVLKDGLPMSQIQLHVDMVASNAMGDSLHADEGGLRHVYMHEGFMGYAGSFAQETIDMLRGQPEVAYIEQSQMFHTMDGGIQKNAPWGLARVSHREKLRLSTFRTYEFDDNGGEGVNVYVVDTGIFIKHEEFEGRARWGKTMPKNDVDEDGNGHGTHCAGTIASAKYGVAKKANVIAVKVLGSNGSGSTEDVIGGVLWAANDASAEKKKAQDELRRTGKTKHKGSVANMSLGGGKSTGLDQAVNAAVRAGVHFAVAAGNENQDACNSSPAGATGPITVGASTSGDERAYFSNYGPCVNVFAPGLNILSTWNGPSKSATNTISGTSMASPHTAGLMAYLLSIYPSVTFNPTIPSKGEEETATGLLLNNPTYQSLVKFAKSTFPVWMTAALPSSSRSLAPIPKPEELTTEVMKKAVIALSTKGALSKLPAQTVNFLIYNNATGIADSKFWQAL